MHDVGVNFTGRLKINEKKVAIGDEMMMVIKLEGTLKIWRKPSKVWKPEWFGLDVDGAEAPITNLKIMAWGALHRYCVGSLCMINGNMNSDYMYIETLGNNLWQVVKKGRSFLFQNDNAPCHR